MTNLVLTILIGVIWPTLIDSKTPVEALGQVLYTYYSYFFIVASLILLISMIGAIMLTLNPNRAVKRQQVFEQNARDFAQTVKKFTLLNNIKRERVHLFLLFYSLVAQR